MGLTNLSKENIKEKVSDYDIFEHFCPYPFTLNGSINSPLREDRNPSFSIRLKNGYYYFIDFTTGDRGDAFDFVMRLHGIGFSEALALISTEMKLDLSDPNSPVSNRKRVEVDNISASFDEKLIQFKKRAFTRDDLHWWASYGIDYFDLSSLPDVKVYSVERYWIDKKLSYISNGICFAYHFENIDKVKLYHPLAKKDKGEMKWISNVPLKTMYGMDGIQNCEKGIVTKSLKDLLVLRKVFPCVCGTQNESLASISDENMKYLTNNIGKIFIHGDSDNAGKEYSKLLTSQFGFSHINTPDYLLKFGVNDFADWAKRDGIDAVAYFLKLKGFSIDISNM